MGAPGSGKGTQAQRLDKHFGVPQVSTGDILRKHLAEGTPLGMRAKEIMAAGGYVDDATMLDIIRDRLAQPDARAGFILDGFPRTLTQADGLARLLGELGTPLDAVVLLEVDSDQLVKRISGRRTCEFCKRVFNVHTAPATVPPECIPGRIEHSLVQRPDDAEETVKERLRIYEEQTRRPLLGYYAHSGLLRTVDAEGDMQEVTQRLIDTLQAGGNSRSRVKPASPPKSRRKAKARPKSKARPKAKAAPRRRAATKRRPAARARPVAKRRAAARKPSRKPGHKPGGAAARKARPARARRKSKRR